MPSHRRLRTMGEEDRLSSSSSSRSRRPLSDSELAALEKDLAWLDMDDGVAEDLELKRVRALQKKRDRAAAKQFRTEVAEKRRQAEQAEQRRRRLRAQFLDSGPRFDGSKAEFERARADSIRKQQLLTRNWEEHEERAAKKNKRLMRQRKLAFDHIAKNEAEVAARAEHNRQRLAKLNAEAKARVTQRCVGVCACSLVRARTCVSACLHVPVRWQATTRCILPALAWQGCQSLNQQA